MNVAKTLSFSNRSCKLLISDLYHWRSANTGKRRQLVIDVMVSPCILLLVVSPYGIQNAVIAFNS